MKRIPLNKGKYALVDDSDYNVLGQLKWTATTSGYAVNGRLGYMHRCILNAPGEFQVDHINHDKLDNQRSNLRLATNAQNTANRPKIKSRSGYKGIWWWEDRKRWKVYIGTEGKSKTIGYFKELADAIEARQAAIKEYHGEFASTES